MTFDFNGLTRAEPFFVEYEQAYIHGNTLGVEKGHAPTILFLHGEKPSDDRNIFLLLRQVLLDRYEITSCAFDFIGYGTTGGNWKESSLSSRTEQAANIVNACFDSQPFIVVASGMGAYSALKLAELFPIESLVLVSPKVYTVEMYDAALESFDGSMSYSPEHWDKTDAWSIIGRFNGCISLVGTNKSDPLCSGTMSRLYSHATRSKSRQAYEINGTEQNEELLAYCNQTPSELMRLAKIIKNACESASLNELASLAT